MPVYEYQCDTCGRMADLIRKHAESKKPIPCAEEDGPLDCEGVLQRTGEIESGHPTKHFWMP